MTSSPTPSEPRQKHQGVSDKWDLHWRSCENCGKRFKQIQPHQRFCQDPAKPKDFCRKQFHRNGSAYAQLKERVSKMLDEKLREASKQIYETLLALDHRLFVVEKKLKIKRKV
jgi:hypothetical protein